jgi:predicted nucleotidyltransferase
MDDATEKKSLLELCVDALMPFGVEFIVIGGQAETLLGSARITFDVDFCYRRSQENLERLARALIPLKPTLRNAPPDLPFRLDARSLAVGSNFTFHTIHGPLDLLGYIEPIGGYEEALVHAVEMDFGPWRIKVMSLDDLIRIKEHICRPKDRDALMQLLAIRRVREEQGGAP